MKSTDHLFFVGPIPVSLIAASIEKHSKRTAIGAHDIFLGQVRADIVNGSRVQAIDYSAYKPMASEILAAIREEAIVDHKLSCAHVLHSLGVVNAGAISLFVFTSAPHRVQAFEACRIITERIKKEVPVFGKEIFADGSSQWKVNTP